MLGALDGRVPADLAAGAPAGGDLPGGGLLDGEPVVSTYHSYAARLVADHALREALEPTVRLITPAVSWQLAARVVAAYAGPMDAVHWAPQSVTAAVLDLAGELAEHLASPASIGQIGDWLEAAARALPRVPSGARKILDTQRTREQLLPMVAAYAAAKAAREVIDYGDQVTLAARIATRHREVGAIERARYQVVLLDEFQDTSYAQLVLLKALFGGGHPVTAVGDPCQSIYGWRGASAGNLARFSREFPAGAQPARVAQLATSFRNTGRVLDAAAVIQRDLRDQVSQVPRLVAPPGRAGRGAVVCALLEAAAGEARWVAEQVADLLRLPGGHRPGRRALGPAPGPAVRHRRALPQALPVRPAARGDRGARGPGRGGRPGRAAHRPRGRRHRGHAAGAARPGRLRRAGPAAHRATMADRAAGPRRPWPARP